MPGFSILKKIHNWFIISKPVPPSGASYSAVTQYTINELTVSIKYNTKVIKIAYFSFCLWVALLICYSFCKQSLAVFFDIKLYPAPLWALISGAFSELDKLEKRKELNEFINTHVIDGDDNPLTDHIKATAWDEYKNF